MALPEGTLRSFSGAAVPTTITTNVGDTSTSITIVDGSTWPQASNSRWAAALIDEGNTNEEVIWYSSRVGNTLQNCIRGGDGTVASSHAVGATIKHVPTALDFREANEHYANTDPNFVPHSQLIHKTIGQIIPANHTFSGNINLNGSTTVTGAITMTGTTNIAVASIQVITGLVNFQGAVTYADTRQAPKVITPTSSASQGIKEAPMRADAQVSLDVKAFLRAFIPAGTIRMWAGSSLPTGPIHEGEWQFADGGGISAATFPEYFTNVGTTFGGTSTTPLKPNLNGRVPVGSDSGHTLGSTGGSLTKSLTAENNGVHNHPTTNPPIDLNFGDSDFVINAPNGEQNHYVPNKAGQPPVGSGWAQVTFTNLATPGANVQTLNSGNGLPFSLEQPWTAVRYIVKVH